MNSMIQKENGHFEEEEEEHLIGENDFLDEEEKGSIPDRAWKQFVLGRERHGLIQIITCQLCGFKTSYSSLRAAILEHLNTGCALSSPPSVSKEVVENSISAPCDESKSVSNLPFSDPFRLQKFNVAENRRLKIPNQYLLKDEMIREMRKRGEEQSHVSRESSDGSHPEKLLNSDFYGRIVDHMSSCWDQLKELEMQRNRQLLEENYNRAMQTWKWRQAQIQQRENHPQYEIKRAMKFTRMPVVQRFSRPKPVMSLLKKEETGSVKIEETTEETEDSISIMVDSDDEHDNAEEESDKELNDSSQQNRNIPKQFRSQSLFSRLNKNQMIKTASITLTIDQSILQESRAINNQFLIPKVNGTPAKLRFNTTIPKISTIPTSCFFLKIEENQGTEDQMMFRSVPYLGDDIRLDLGEFNRMTGNLPGQIEPEVCGESEELLVTYFLEKGNPSTSVTISDTLHTISISPIAGYINGEYQIQEERIVPEIIKGLAVILEVSIKEILRIYKIIAESAWYRNHINPRKQLQNSVDRIIGYEEHLHCASLLSLIGLDESSFNPDDRSHLECGIGIGLGVLNVPNYTKMVSNYRDFFCRRCYILNCSDHLIQHPLPQQRVDPTPPLLCPFTKLLLLPNDFIRFNRRPQLLSNRYLVEPFPTTQRRDMEGHSTMTNKYTRKAEEEEDDEEVVIITENRSSSQSMKEKKLSLVDKLQYDSSSRAIVMKQAGDLDDAVMIPMLKDCEMFEWLERNEDKQLTFCLPCVNSSFLPSPTPENNSPKLQIRNPQRSRKRAYDPTQSDLLDFQPLYRQRLRVDRPSAVIEALDHPIINSLGLLPASTFDCISPIKKNQRTNPLIKSPHLSRAPNSNNSMIINLAFDEEESTDEVTKTSKRQKTKDSPSVSAITQSSKSTPPSTLDTTFINRKRKFQLSFRPPLADSELALIEKLVSIYPRFKPFSTPFYQPLPFEDFFTTRNHQIGDTTATVAQFPYNQMLSQELKHSKSIPLVQFIADLLQTRQIEEIVRILQESEWLFIHKDTEVTVSYPSTLEENHRNSKSGLESSLMQLEDYPDDDDDTNNDRKYHSSDDDNDEDAMVLFTSGVNTTSSSNNSKLQIKTNHHSYQACGHLGPCSNDNKNCTCVQFGTFCEKYCCCDKLCRRRFRGCNCSRGLCQTKACPCFAANRACDPDTCGSCGASVHPLQLKLLQSRLLNDSSTTTTTSNTSTIVSSKANKLSSSSTSKPHIKDLIDLTTEEISKGQSKQKSSHAVLPISKKDSNNGSTKHPPLSSEDIHPASIELKICSNLPFHLRTPKKICIKPSLIHGWGAFAMESIEKHDFVIEYKGEIITQDEADRRGIIYDQLNLSYLFNITNESVLDATRKGNKAKFLNHSDNPNCITRVMQIFGDHKVGIFAKRDIAIGEELTFDYCYDRHVPKWVKGKNSSSLSSSTGNTTSQIQKKSSNKSNQGKASSAGMVGGSKSKKTT